MSETLLPCSLSDNILLDNVLDGDRFERGEQKYEHMLDGDGYVCAFSFNEEGRMHFRSAYVRTRYIKAASFQTTVVHVLLFGAVSLRCPVCCNTYAQDLVHQRLMCSHMTELVPRVIPRQ